MLIFCLHLCQAIVNAFLVARVRVDFPPAFLIKQSEFKIANLSVAVRVHIAEQFLYVFKADLKAEEVDGLCPLVEGNRLGVVGVYVSESLAQVPEPLTYLERDEAEKF